MNNRRKKMSIIWCLVAIAVMVSSPIQAQNTGQQMKGATEVPLDTDEQTGVTRAVVIGISNYQYIDPLQYAARDAEFFYSYLTSPSGGSIDSANIQLLLNKQANIGNMVSAFEWLKDESVEGDQVIIYFSGHGDVETLTDAHNGFLLTYNSPKAVYFAGAFPVYILKDYLTTLSKKDVQVTFIVDACRSGKLAGGAAGASQTNQVLQQQWQNEVKILSCQPGEYSLESASMGGGRGIFSYHLIRGLQGLADMNKNMEVTLSELWMYLSIQVPMATDPLPQNPLVSGKMQTTLANVDLATLQALHEDQGTLGTLVASLNPKGFVDDILEKIDTADARSYRIFEKSLEDGDLLTPVRFAAYEIYIDFLSKEIEEKLIQLMRRNLLAAFQNEAQETINAYLNGEVSGIEDQREDFTKAARHMGKAIELLREGHPFTNFFKARKLFLEARALYDTKDPEEVTLALEKLHKSIELEPQAAYSYNAIGLYYDMKYDREQAIEVYRKAHNMVPTWQFPIQNLAHTFKALNKFDSAMKYLEVSLALDSTDSWSYNSLGLVYTRLKDYDKAMFNFKKAISLSPYYDDPYRYLAELFEDLGNLDSAEIYYKKAIEVRDWDADNYNNLGLFYKEHLRYEEALANFKKAVSLDSTYSFAYTNIGDIYMKDEIYDTALIYYEKALQCERINPMHYNNLGYYYEQIDDDVKATTWYKAAIEVDPNYKYSYYNMGGVFDRAAEYDSALVYYKRALEIDPTNTSYAVEVALVYESMLNFEKAREYYELSIKLDPKYAYGYNYIGILLYNNNDYEAALVYYQKAIEADPSVDIFYYNTGLVYDYSSDSKNAIKSYLKTLEINPDHFWCNANLADLYFNDGKYDKAIHYADDALVIDPTSDYAHNIIGYSFLKKGKYKLAKRSFESALNLDESDSWNYYTFACYFSVTENFKESLNWLEKAFEKGFASYNHVRTDDDMSNAMTHPEFEELIKKYEER